MKTVNIDGVECEVKSQVYNIDGGSVLYYVPLPPKKERPQIVEAYGGDGKSLMGLIERTLHDLLDRVEKLETERE